MENPHKYRKESSARVMAKFFVFVLFGVLLIAAISGCSESKAPAAPVKKNDQKVIMLNQTANNSLNIETPVEIPTSGTGAILVQFEAPTSYQVSGFDLTLTQLRMTKDDGTDVKPFQSLRQATVSASQISTLVSATANAGKYTSLRISFKPGRVMFTGGNSNTYAFKSQNFDVPHEFIVYPGKTTIVTLFTSLDDIHSIVERKSVINMTGINTTVAVIDGLNLS